MLETIHDLLDFIFGPVERILTSQGLGFPELGTSLAVIGILTSIRWISIFRKAG